MTKKKPEPEKGMTRDEARSLASGIASGLSDRHDDGLADLILLLRWFAYRATDDDRETIYIQVEEEYAAYFDGVDEAVRQVLQRTLDALRQRRSRKGGE